MNKRLLVLTLLAALGFTLTAHRSEGGSGTVKIQNFDGTVYLDRKGRQLKVKADSENPFLEGDAFSCETDGVVDILMHDFAGFELVGESEFKVLKTALSETRIYFAKGAPVFNVRLLPPGAQLVMETESITVKPAKAQFYISTQGQASTVCVYNGEVFVTAKGSGSSLKVTQGFCVDATDDDNIAQLRPATPEDEDSFSNVNTIPASD